MLAQARNGIIIPPLTSFDGNVITPGTPFMARLADHLRRFLAYKVGHDSDWRHIQVIPALVHVVVCNISACTLHRDSGCIHEPNMVGGNTHQPAGWQTAGAQDGLLVLATVDLSLFLILSLEWICNFKSRPC